MNTILLNMKSEVHKFFLFEKKVCSLLHIDQCHFQIYVRHNGGYALLLRNWIKESYNKGSTPKEVVQTIKESKLIKDELSSFCPTKNL